MVAHVHRMIGGRKETDKKRRAAESIDAKRSAWSVVSMWDLFWAWVWGWFSASCGQTIGKTKLINSLEKEIRRLKQDVHLLTISLGNSEEESKMLRL